MNDVAHSISETCLNWSKAHCKDYDNAKEECREIHGEVTEPDPMTPLSPWIYLICRSTSQGAVFLYGLDQMLSEVPLIITLSSNARHTDIDYTLI